MIETCKTCNGIGTIQLWVDESCDSRNPGLGGYWEHTPCPDCSKKTEKRPMTKPCEETCPKCGASDLSLMYFAEGDSMRSWFKKIRDKSYIDTAGRNTVARREFIKYHCRVCQYDWEGPPMGEAGGNYESDVR
jgi:hypothetical protein